MRLGGNSADWFFSLPLSPYDIFSQELQQCFAKKVNFYEKSTELPSPQYFINPKILRTGSLAKNVDEESWKRGIFFKEMI